MVMDLAIRGRILCEYEPGQAPTKLDAQTWTALSVGETVGLNQALGILKYSKANQMGSTVLLTRSILQ